jgi:hypothetical protein
MKGTEMEHKYGTPFIIHDEDLKIDSVIIPFDEDKYLRINEGWDNIQIWEGAPNPREGNCTHRIKMDTLINMMMGE